MAYMALPIEEVGKCRSTIFIQLSNIKLSDKKILAIKGTKNRRNIEDWKNSEERTLVM